MFPIAIVAVTSVVVAGVVFCLPCHLNLKLGGLKR